MAHSQTWDPERYARNARFVADLGAPVVDLLAPRAGERILDLGCGDGVLTAKLASMGCEVVGVDASAAQIDAARKLGVDARVMNGEALDFNSEFDAVFSNAALHWMRNPAKVIAGIHRALRPQGRFVAEFGGKGNTGELLMAVQHAWAKLGLAGPAPHPWYYPSVAEYAGLLEQQGFEVTHATLFDRPTPLDDGERGLRNWLEMFGSAFVEGLPEAARERLLVEIERELRPKLFHDDHWVMDYRRLRVVAKRLE